MTKQNERTKDTKRFSLFFKDYSISSFFKQQNMAPLKECVRRAQYALMTVIEQDMINSRLNN